MISTKINQLIRALYDAMDSEYIQTNDDKIIDLLAQAANTIKDLVENNKQLYDWKWNCRDFNYGECPKLENTCCNGCDFKNNWKWRGD